MSKTFRNLPGGETGRDKSKKRVKLGFADRKNGGVNTPKRIRFLDEDGEV